jgi:hypothetical protein
MQHAALPDKPGTKGGRPMKLRQVIINTIAAAMVIACGCSKDRVISGTEITNGNCVGKIYNPDGTAAKGALVKLIPADYNPFVQKGDSLDSTVTTAAGDYAFNVSQSKFYNIVAEKGPTSCMLDSIFVQADAKTMVDNDTLRESGWLSGALRLKPGDDGSKAVILVLGANVYMVPSDTAGSFTSPLLPKGSYTIRIFTTLTGYAVFDTVIAVQEGVETKLAVNLPSSNAPSISNLSAAYDSASMIVSFQWSMPDTSKIVSYALYRKNNVGNDARIMLDKSATSAADTVVGFDGDSISYEIAAMGKNFMEGYRAVTQKIVVCGKAYCVKKMDLTNISTGLYPPGEVSIYAYRENEIFLVGEHVIYKLDTNGMVRKDYQLDHSSPVNEGYFPGVLQGDDGGHLYIQKVNSEHRAVIKFDADLNVIAELSLDSGDIGSIMVQSNGTICAFYNFTDSALGNYTEIKVYNSAFNAVKDFRIMNRLILNGTSYGDTIVTNEYQAGQNSIEDIRSITFYDTAFTQLSTFKESDFSGSRYCTPQLCGESDAGYTVATPFGLFISVIETGESSLIFTTGKGEFLASIIVPASGRMYGDLLGNLYCVSYEQTGTDVYAPKTLFKYTMAPLLKKNAR